MMLNPAANPASSLAVHVLWVVDCFCKTMAPEACKRRIGLLSIALWARVKRFERRFCQLYAMWKAGKLPPPRPTASIPAAGLPSRREAASAADAPWDPMACDAASVDRASLRPASVLPRRLAWLQRTLPSSAATLGGGIEALLRNFPEMKEFAAACPQVGRILRPLCRMARLKVPEYLALPKRARGDQGETRQQVLDAPPRSAAARKPIGQTKFGAAPSGYFSQRPQDLPNSHDPPDDEDREE
jgi:hypothetical protein